MSGIRVLVGTKKGAFILTSDGKRAEWSVDGPHFAGWEVYHMKGSPVDPDRLYASQTSAWFGQIIQRSNDGGKSWDQPGLEPADMPNFQAPPEDGPPMPPKIPSRFVYDTSAATGKPLTTHQWYDGSQHPWEFARVWHLEPSLTERDVVYAGVEDAALFRSDDGGESWHELAGLRGHGTGPQWQPGAGGMCLHTILLDRTDPRRMFVAISAAGAFRTEDARSRRGRRSIAGSSPSSCRTPRPRSAIVCTTWPCIRRARTCCTCRSTGTSAAARTPATPGTR